MASLCSPLFYRVRTGGLSQAEFGGPMRDRDPVGQFGLFDDDDMADLYLGGREPIRLYERAGDQVIVDVENDLRCCLVGGSAPRGAGFDRAGVLVGVAERSGWLLCDVQASEHLANDLAERHRQGPDRWTAALAPHAAGSPGPASPDTMFIVVSKTLASFQRVKLKNEYPDSRVMKAPPHVGRAGQLAVLALRIGGWMLGPVVANPPRLEPDWMWEL